MRQSHSLAGPDRWESGWLQRKSAHEDQAGHPGRSGGYGDEGLVRRRDLQIPRFDNELYLCMKTE